MAISKEKLAEIISGRAKELCSPNAEKIINNKASKYNNPDPSDYDYDASMYDEMYLGESKEYNDDIFYNENTSKSSKMPENIKQSMLNERIDMSSFSSVSVLDELGVKPTRKPKQQPKQITEQNVMPQYTQQSSIDYSIIKAIVNECLKEHLNKQPLNESTSLKTIALSAGTITLVDNKGSIFKAKLQKISNNEN